MSNTNTHTFTDSDRDACLPIIDFLVECADVAKNEGTLALHELVYEHDNYFLKFAMSMIADGFDPEYVKNVSTILVNSENHTGQELLERKIITEAVLSIQTGEHPRAMEMKLFAYLGENYLKKRGYSHPPEHKPPKSAHFLVRLHTVVAENSLPECKKFEKAVLALSDDALRQVIMETEQRWWVKALKGCGEDVAKKIGNNVSRRLEKMIAEDIEYIGTLDTAVILDEQSKIMNVISRLTGAGDITLAGETGSK